MEEKQTNRAPYHKGRQSAVLGYVFEQPHGKHITVQEIEKHFKGKYSRHQIMATMVNICGRVSQRDGLPVERVTQGVWKVASEQNGNGNGNGKPTYTQLDVTVEKVGVAPPKVGGSMLIEVLKDRGDYLLVEDVDDRKIYKMTLVG